MNTRTSLLHTLHVGICANHFSHLNKKKPNLNEVPCLVCLAVATITCIETNGASQGCSPYPAINTQSPCHPV